MFDWNELLMFRLCGERGGTVCVKPAGSTGFVIRDGKRYGRLGRWDERV